MKTLIYTRMKERFTFLWNSGIFSQFSNMKYIPRWIVLLVDLFLCLLSYYVSYYISSRLYNNALDERTLSLFQQMEVVFVLQIFFFWVFKTYAGVLRYSGYVDAIKLLLAVIYYLCAS